MAIILTLHGLAAAQDTIPLINSGKVIQEGVALHDEGKYEEAIAKYLTIPESDTNYIVMLSELMYSYTSSGQDQKALEAGYPVKDIDSPNNATILMVIGNALDNLGKREEAITVYRDALKKFPYVHLLYYNLGLTYFNVGNYKDAVKCFQQSLTLQPFHPGSHLQLGKCMILEGSRTKAILSLETYLIIKPSDNKTLVLLENLVNDAVTDEGTTEPVTDNSMFHQTDLILKSKAAMDNRFQTAIQLDASITRQTELLFEILPCQAEGEDFWVRYYLPLYERIKKQNLIQPFIYTWLSSVNNEKVKKWGKDNKSLLENFYRVANEQMSVWNRRGHVTLPGGSEAIKTFWYYDSKELNYIGDVDGNQKPVGYWLVYYKNGHKKAEGNFNEANNKEGTWKYYYDNGMLHSVETEQDGVLTDTLMVFHDNGIIKSMLPYDQGKLNGTARYFFNCGDIKEVTHFDKGLRKGLSRLYYPDNKLATEMHFIRDTLDGPYQTFYVSGNKHEAYGYVNGKMEGAYYEYFSTGGLKEKGKYEGDKKTGMWTGFYDNGGKKYQGTFNDGKRSGTWKTFYKNGNQKEIINYRNGLLSGDYKTFDDDGILHHVQTYEQDTLTGQRFYNKEGKILSDESDKNGNFSIQAFFPDGSPDYKATYQNGLLEGEVITYYRNGIKKMIQHFKKGYKEGPLKAFYETGELQYGVDFRNGKEHGYYRSFYENGQINEEGWFQDGLKQQKWVLYDQLGNILERNYYINDQLHGIYLQYAPGNKPYLKYRYAFGDIIETVQYDSAGNVLNKINFKDGQGMMDLLYHDKNVFKATGVQCGLFQEYSTTYYPDGKPKVKSTPPDSSGRIMISAWYPSGQLQAKGSLLNGERSGKWIWYHDNGNIETKCYYDEGKATGKWTDYYDNGNIKIVRQFENNELNGTFSFYDLFGQLIYEKTYFKGMPLSYRYMTGENKWSDPVKIEDGTLKSYFANGKVSAVESYLNGFFNGERKIYYSNGHLYKTTCHDHGLSQKTSVTWYPSGQIKFKIHHLDGEIHGNWTSYYKNGKIHEQKSYYLGKLHGPAMKYDENGELVSEIYYWNDELY